MLEVRIEELTKSVRDLIDVMHNLIDVMHNQQGVALAAARPVDVDNKDAERPNASSKSEHTPDTSQASSPESKTVTYEDVKRITIAVSAKDKPKAVAALARFGVTSAKGLQEGQWGEYVAYMQKVVSGEVDPEASE